MLPIGNTPEKIFIPHKETAAILQILYHPICEDMVVHGIPISKAYVQMEIDIYVICIGKCRVI